MKKGILLLFSCLFFMASIDAQYSLMTPAKDTVVKNKSFDPSRLVFGGNLGASFGDFTFINFSPQVGYQFSNVLTAGAGINYIFQSAKYRDFNGNEIYKNNFGYAGINIFGRIFPTNFLFISAQPEINYNWGKTKFKNGQADLKLESKWVPTFLVGAGAVVGGRNGRGMLLSVQYDLAQDPRSPYGNKPYINIGFGF